MKKNRTKFALLFFLSLLMLAIFTMVLPSKAFSDNENRPLAQKPHLSAASIQNGSVQSDLSAYLSDQVPFRDFWIKVSTTIKKLSGQKVINGVYLGDDHCYFQQFTESSYSTLRMAAVFRLIEVFLQQQDALAAVMLVPSPGTVLSNKLPSDAPYYDADVIFDTANQAISCPVIDLRERFEAEAETAQLYYRTDHHWTGWGAYLAYQEYCLALEKEPEVYKLEQVADGFRGTLYSKVLDIDADSDAIYAPTNIPKVRITYDDGTISETPYRKDNLAQKDKYTYFFGGNYGMVTICTESKNPEKLLVIKDSFANSFVPFLFRDYSEIVMLDLRYFAGNVEEIIMQHEITQILFLYEVSNLLTDTSILNLQK